MTGIKKFLVRYKIVISLFVINAVSVYLIESSVYGYLRSSIFYYIVLWILLIALDFLVPYPLRPLLKMKKFEVQFPNLQKTAVENSIHRFYSRTSSALNAFAMGIGKSRTIVINELVLQRCPPDEIEAVLWHEMGHQIYKHPKKRATSLWWAAVFAGIIGLILRGIIGDHPTLFFLLTIGVSWAITLIVLSKWRKQELQADAYAVQHGTNSKALITFFERVNNFEIARGVWIPKRFGRIRELLSTHPLMAKRIATINALT